MKQHAEKLHVLAEEDTNLVGDSFIVFVPSFIQDFMYGSEIHSQACFTHGAQLQLLIAVCISLWNAE